MNKTKEKQTFPFWLKITILVILIVIVFNILDSTRNLNSSKNDIVTETPAGEEDKEIKETPRDEGRKTEIIKYTVTYDSNGGSAVNQVSVEENAKLERPKDPTKDGYTFIGWQLDGIAYNFDTRINDNIALKATWSKNETLSQKNAVRKAIEYLAFSSFSRGGLIAQLEYEKFSKEDAAYGVDNSGADWKEQAVKKAHEYLKFSSFSRQGLIDQLIYEKFTREQAIYGVDATGL